jgi:hypothetical protein
MVQGLYFSFIYSFLSQLVVPTLLLAYGSYLVFHGKALHRFSFQLNVEPFVAGCPTSKLNDARVELK